MYSAAAKNKYAELLEVTLEKLASTYGITLQESSEKQPQQGADNAAKSKR